MARPNGSTKAGRLADPTKDAGVRSRSKPSVCRPSIDENPGVLVGCGCRPSRATLQISNHSAGCSPSRPGIRRSARPCVFGSRPPSGVTARSVLRSEEHTSELQSRRDLVCRLLLEKKKEQTRRQNTAERNYKKEACQA